MNQHNRLTPLLNRMTTLTAVALMVALAWALFSAIAAAQTSVPLVRVGGASGTLIARDRVVTAAHVIGGRSRVSCRFDFLPGVQRTSRRILTSSYGRDVAIFEILPVDAKPVTVASDVPRVGETVYLAGYAPDGRISSTGRMRGMQGGRSPRMLIAGSINLGDSGGCCLNSKYEFCGVLCAKDTPGNMPGRTAYVAPVVASGPFGRWLRGGSSGSSGNSGGRCPYCPNGNCPHSQGRGSGLFGGGRGGQGRGESLIPGNYDTPLDDNPPPGYGSPFTPPPSPGGSQLVPIQPPQQQRETPLPLPPPNNGVLDKLLERDRELSELIKRNLEKQQTPAPLQIDYQAQIDDLKERLEEFGGTESPDCSRCEARVEVLETTVVALRVEIEGLRAYHKTIEAQFAALLKESRIHQSPGISPEIGADELVEIVKEMGPMFYVRAIQMVEKPGGGYIEGAESTSPVHPWTNDRINIHLFPPK